MAVLGRKAIETRIAYGDRGRGEIFLSGTWSPGQLRAAAYDLRIGQDFLITPSGTRYWPGAPQGRRKLEVPFTIKPGEVAFVSSAEELTMPGDLAANIAIRFRTASAGVFVMGGLLVDPGYRGRLHFQLANIGDEKFIVVPGETSVAALQFLPIIGDPSPADEAPSSREFLDKLFFIGADEPLPPLAFFPKALSAHTDVSKATRMAEELEVEVRATKRSTEQLVVFGVFLVSATLFTVAVAALIDALAGGTYEKAGKVLVASTEFSLAGALAAIAVLLAIGIAIAKMMSPVRDIVRRDESTETPPVAEHS